MCGVSGVSPFGCFTIKCCETPWTEHMICILNRQNLQNKNNHLTVKYHPAHVLTVRLITHSHGAECMTQKEKVVEVPRPFT